jgi:hypothetical protein
MAANRRRLVHRLQAEDPLDLSASGDKCGFRRMGLARLSKPDTNRRLVLLDSRFWTKIFQKPSNLREKNALPNATPYAMGYE